MVTDFGIARLAADAEGAIPGTTLGSVHYFSPEQAKGETTTGASDVYSLGLVLYEALTGQRAWRGETTAALAAVRIGADAPSPRADPPGDPGRARRGRRPGARSGPGASLRQRGRHGRRARTDRRAARPGEPDGRRPDRDVGRGRRHRGWRRRLAERLRDRRRRAGCRRAWLPRHRCGRRRPRPPPAGATPVRRASPAIAGPLFVLVVVAAVVAGGLFVASLAGRCGFGRRSRSPRPRRNRRARRRPTARPTAGADRRADRQAQPTPVPKPATPSRRPARRATCAIRSSASRAAWRRGPTSRRGSSRRSGSSSATAGRPRSGSPTSSASDRQEGGLTFASGLLSVYPNGDATDAPRSASLADRDVHRDRRGRRRAPARRAGSTSDRATVVDLAPTGPDRVALFGTSTQTFYPRAVRHDPARRHRWRRGWSVVHRHRAARATRRSRRSCPRPTGSSTSVRFR